MAQGTTQLARIRMRAGHHRACENTNASRPQQEWQMRGSSHHTTCENKSCVYIHMYKYKYIYMERERDRDRDICFMLLLLLMLLACHASVTSSTHFVSESAMHVGWVPGRWCSLYETGFSEWTGMGKKLPKQMIIIKWIYKQPAQPCAYRNRH